MIDRERMLAALKLVEPALAKKDLIEEFTHIWFDGKYATASNDNGLGIRVPFKCNLYGGLPGNLLIGLLSNSKIKDVDVNGTEGDDVKLQAGRARALFSSLSMDRMMAELPTLKKTKMGAVSPELVVALKNALPFVGAYNSEMPEQTGITIIPGEKYLNVVATDDDTMTLITCGLDNWPLDKRITLSVPFVEQFIIAAEEDCEFGVYKGTAVAHSSKMTVWDKAVEVAKPTDMLALINKTVEHASFTTIPGRLKLALARAFVALNGVKEPYVSFKVAKGVLRMQTSGAAELSDKMQLEDEVPEVETKLNPALIKRGLKMCDHIAIDKRSTVLTNMTDFTYMIASFE